MNELTRVSEFRLKLYPKDFYLVRKFYEENLGFDVVHDWDRTESKGVMLNTGSAIIELLYPGDTYEESKGINLSLEVKDVNSLWEKFKNKDFIAYAIKHNSWGDTSFGIYDPEGFRITFFTQDK